MMSRWDYRDLPEPHMIDKDEFRHINNAFDKIRDGLNDLKHYGFEYGFLRNQRCSRSLNSLDFKVFHLSEIFHALYLQTDLPKRADVFCSPGCQDWA